MRLVSGVGGLDKSRRSGEKYHSYVHEMDKADHGRLLGALRGLEGAVVLSGYPSALYDEALADWTRLERAALADGARPRTEVLWLNARTTAGHGLFAEARDDR